MNCIDITLPSWWRRGALRPIAPEHLRPWPSEVSRPRSSMGDAATLTDVLGREVQLHAKYGHYITGDNISLIFIPSC